MVIPLKTHQKAPTAIMCAFILKSQVLWRAFRSAEAASDRHKVQKSQSIVLTFFASQEIKSSDARLRDEVTSVLLEMTLMLLSVSGRGGEQQLTHRLLAHYNRVGLQLQRKFMASCPAVFSAQRFSCLCSAPPPCCCSPTQTVTCPVDSHRVNVCLEKPFHLAATTHCCSALIWDVILSHLDKFNSICKRMYENHTYLK